MYASRIVYMTAAATMWFVGLGGSRRCFYKKESIIVASNKLALGSLVEDALMIRACMSR